MLLFVVGELYCLSGESDLCVPGKTPLLPDVTRVDRNWSRLGLDASLPSNDWLPFLNDPTL